MDDEKQPETLPAPDALENKSLDELKAIAKKLNITHGGNIKAETLLMKIKQQPQAYVRDSMKHVATTPVPPSHVNTPEQVLDAIKPYMKEGFDARFPNDGTWTFSYKGRDDSGNLSIPLRIIKMKAEMVSRGRMAPKSFGRDGTYGSSYSDTILM